MPAGTFSECVERLIWDATQLSVRVSECLFGRGMVGDGREDTGVIDEHGAHRAGDHRRVDRSPAGRGEAGGTQLFGESPDGREGDIRDATWPLGQCPARCDGDDVGTDHHSDRRKRITTLEVGNLASQEVDRRQAVGRATCFDRWCPPPLLPPVNQYTNRSRQDRRDSKSGLADSLAVDGLGATKALRLPRRLASAGLGVDDFARWKSAGCGAQGLAALVPHLKSDRTFDEVLGILADWTATSGGDAKVSTSWCRFSGAASASRSCGVRRPTV